MDARTADPRDEHVHEVGQVLVHVRLKVPGVRGVLPAAARAVADAVDDPVGLEHDGVAEVVLVAETVGFFARAKFLLFLEIMFPNLMAIFIKYVKLIFQNIFCVTSADLGLPSNYKIKSSFGLLMFAIYGNYSLLRVATLS